MTTKTVALPAFMVFTLGHLAEHAIQAYQFFVLHWSRSQAMGLLGMWYPRAMMGEWLHYGFAIVMLVGMWLLRKQFTGAARQYWRVATVFQFWHHFEHAILLYQCQTHQFWFGRHIQTSVGQIWFPRLELHLFYNLLVFVPMAAAMFFYLFRQKPERVVAVPSLDPSWTTRLVRADEMTREDTDIWQQIYDPQAAGLYNAQQQIFYPGMGLEDAIAMPPDFHTEAEARAFARRVQRSALVKKLYPKFAAFRDLTVVFTDLPRWISAQTDNAYPFEIQIGSTGWSRQKRTLLHELAHVVDNVEFNHRTSKDGHGPAYAGIYLKLLKEFVGDTAADALAAQFKLSHVRAV
jgi:hypothetical protein